MNFRKFLKVEAESLLSRLGMIKPFGLTMPMVNAASVSDRALQGITDLLLRSNKELKSKVHQFIGCLTNQEDLTAEQAQAQYAIIKLRFNALLDSLDIFADVLSQRSEHETGIWVSGLDVLAKDALKLKGRFYEAPPLVCFLERGHGAAIRKSRTRLPGGEMNPVAVIQVPRERMVSSGIASSLIHEVGHQGAAQLNLVSTLRLKIKEVMEDSENKLPWELYSRWISEIIADFWSMAHLGIGATVGLINVVSLPKYFMFRIKMDDPHPFPWIRVMLSISFGKAMYPGEQWNKLEQLWYDMYPLEELNDDIQQTIHSLTEILPEFANLVMQHRTKETRGIKLAEIFPYRQRQPHTLRALYRQWKNESTEYLYKAPPSLVFAVIGQAHSDGLISAEEESRVLTSFLTQWALIRSEKRVVKQNTSTIKQIQEVIN